MILCWFTAVAETDIYVPAFPSMVRFFGISEPQVQDVLSYNFFGIFCACLFYGPLSDRYGRKPILVIGMLLFSFACLGCLLASSFSIFLIFRVIQGVGAACVFTAGSATFWDHYSKEKALIRLGYVNTLMGFGMATAPALGAFLTLSFGWQGSFFCLFVLGILSTGGLAFFYQETLAKEERKKIVFREVVATYMTLVKNRSFTLNMIGRFFLLGSMISYISNLSIIFINYLNVPDEIYPFYQGAPLLSFAIISFFSGHITQKLGVRRTSTFAVSGAGIFFSLLVFASWYFPFSPLAVTVIVCGGIGMVALSLGSLYLIAMKSVFSLRGPATSLMAALRMLVMGGLIEGTSHTFNGSLFALSSTLWAFVFLGGACYFFGTQKKILS